MSMLQRPRRIERGTSLVEAMIAAAVMTFGVLGLLPMFYKSTAGISVASRLTQATALAESKLDELMRLPYAAPALNAGTTNDGATNILPTGLLASSEFAAPDGNFYRAWTVTMKDYNATFPGDDFKIITVTVTWYDAAIKRPRAVSLTGGKAMLE